MTPSSAVPLRGRRGEVRGERVATDDGWWLPEDLRLKMKPLIPGEILRKLRTRPAFFRLAEAHEDSMQTCLQHTEEFRNLRDAARGRDYAVATA